MQAKFSQDAFNGLQGMSEPTIPIQRYQCNPKTSFSNNVLNADFIQHQLQV
jgi:hypothetical protein